MNTKLNNKIEPAKNSAWLFRLASFGLAFLSGYCLSSCYRPSFVSSIYKCDSYACPAGLVCNSDKVCVYDSLIGCSNGGIPVDGKTVLCPGLTNRCGDTYALCNPAIPDLACMQGQAIVGDMGAGEPCKVCCGK